MDLEPSYQCPGEAYEISRSVHLGRLAGFYPACGGCPHRGEIATISARRFKQLDDVHRQLGQANPLFHREGISGIYLNEIGPQIARRIGQALGMSTLATWPDARAPRIFVANDGRAWTAELAAAATDGLRWAGCNVVDLGAATAPCLALAAERQDAAGALFAGNSGGKLRDVSFSLTGPHGEPMSSPGALEAVRQLFHSPALPRSRPFGSFDSHSAESDYLDQFETYFHALRPLQLVIATTSQALTHYLTQLTSAVAVKIDWAGALTDASTIAERVLRAEAHFGVWIDGDGEACRVIDERGEPVQTDALFALIGREFWAERPAAQLSTITEHSDRQSVWKAIRDQAANIAADGEGQIWYAGPPTRADALRTVTLLLTLLSRGDRPLSELIASAIL